MNLALAMLSVCISQGAEKETSKYTPARFIEAAREVLGVHYFFGGRMRAPGEGIDCQGVLFFAAERVGACGWKSFSVMPTQSVRDAELGERVAGLDPVEKDDLDVARLSPGDVLWFVDFPENPAEGAIGEMRGRPVWVWHTGIYSGAGRFIVGDHFAGAVVELDLQPYLRAHYAGLFVTRMRNGPQPKRCRTHQPMSRK